MIKEYKENKKELPLIIQYSNLIQKYGLGSKETIKFREQYKDDYEFISKASVLEIITRTKD